MAEHQGGHGAGRLLLQRRHGVAVGVEGDGDVGVSEPFLHYLRVDTGGQGQGCMGVAEVMQADDGQVGRLVLVPCLESGNGGRVERDRPAALRRLGLGDDDLVADRDQGAADRDLARPRSTSGHWRPSSSPRRIPVEAASSQRA